MPLSDNMRGAVFMTVSTAGFACNDAAMKMAFQSIPVAEGVFARGIAGTLFITLLAWRMGALSYRPDRRERRVLALRTLAEVGATITFLQALKTMPLATASSVLQFVPLGVTMAAALLLGEKVGWRRWSAIAFGFAGVLVMIQPGSEGFDSTIFYPLATVGFITLRDVTTRYMDPRTPSVFASVMTMLAVTIFSGLWMPFQGIEPMTVSTWSFTLLAGAIIIVGYVLSVTANRLGDISAVSPFRYTVLVWAMLLGYLVFGEVPEVSTIIGALMVVAAGLYTLWRETVVGRGLVAAHASSRPLSSSSERGA